MKKVKLNVMTTNNHLNNFIELDSKSREELLKTSDELLKVEHLDLDNTKYLAKILFYLQKYDESIEQYKRALTLNSDDENAIVFIGINYFKKGNYEKAIKYFTMINPIEHSRTKEEAGKMLYKRQLYDRYKRIKCIHSHYEYLDIPYTAFDKKETYKQLIDDKINEILNITKTS